MKKKFYMLCKTKYIFSKCNNYQFIFTESGILADMYSGGDEDTQSHRRVERSNSTVTTISVDSALSPVPSTSPVSPAAPTSPSLTTVLPFTGTSDVIYEVPPTPSTSTKDSTAKTLLTTEVIY